MPIQPGWTVGEVASHLSLAGARAVLVDPGPSAVRDAAGRLGLPAVEIRPTARTGGFEVADPPAPRVAAAPLAPPGPDDLALVVTSSGSTGTPVAVPRTHDQMVRSSVALVEALALDGHDRCLSLTPVFRTIALAGLVSGGATIVPDGFDGTDVRRWFGDLAPTWIISGPVVLGQLQAVLRRQRDLRPPAELRFVLSSGAHLPVDLADELEDRLGVPVLGTYGSVETYRVASGRPTPGGHRRGTVGTALGCELRIVDRHGAPAPAGTEGEIVVRGPSVAAGYLGAPEATAARFRDGWFHTRDLGVLDVDGFLTLTGRADDRINRGGEMISPQEVEEVLVRHPDVAAAVCVGLPHPTLGEEVAAAVVPRPGGHVRAAVLRAHVARHLGPSKVPRVVVEVDGLEVSAADKVARRAIVRRLAWAAAPATDRERVPPSTATAGRLAALWDRVLPFSVDPCDDDDFFDVGGNSLAALELVTQVELTFGVQLSPGDLLRASDLRSMAATIDTEVAAGTATRALGPRTLVRLREGSGDAVVMIPGVSGVLLSQARVGRLLATTHPVIGLEAPGLRPGERAAISVAALAEHHRRELDGAGVRPGLLVGASFGGLVAVALADLFTRAGRPVAGVVLLDSSAPQHARAAARAERRRQGRLRSGWAAAREWGDWLVAPHGSLDVDDRVDRTRRIHRRAVARVRLPHCPVPAVVVSTEASRRRVGDPALGWGDLCADLTTICVPGDHRAVLRDEAETTAAIIDALVAGERPAEVAARFTDPTPA